MSFDLYEPETADRLARLAPVKEPEAGAWDGFARGAGLVTMRNLARAGRAIDLAGSVGPIAKDAISGGTEAQDRYFKEHDEVWGSAVDSWTPRPNEVGVAGQIVGELASMLPLVIASPALAVGSMQLGTAEDLVRKGVDATKAQAVGAVQGAGLGLGIWMPIIGQNLWQRLVVGGAGFNLLQGVATRAGSELILEGTPQAEEFKTFDGQSITLDTLMGAAFGAVVHLSPGARAQGAEAWKRIEAWAEGLTPTQKSAIVALRLAQHLNVDSAPGVPATPADVEAHVNRVRTAIEQLERGQPVEVSDIAEPHFQPDPARLKEMSQRADELTAASRTVARAEDLEVPEQKALRIDYNQALTPEMAMVQNRFGRALEADAEAAIKAYERLDATDGGKILNTDLARELSPDYAASLESRARYAAAVHEPASALVKEIYTRKLAEPDENGLNMVTFTAGGTGAGKTGAIAGTPLASKISQVSQIVYDTNMNTFSSSVDKIDQAIAAGKQVNILWVGRDPVEALQGAIKRAIKIGRTVPISEHAKTHIGAASTVERLMEHYQGNDRVQFVFLDNGGAKGEVLVAGPELPRSYNFDNLEVRLKEALDAEYQKGHVPQHVYQGFAGHDPEAAGAAPGGAGSGQPAGEHAPVRGRGLGKPLEEGAAREEVTGARPPAPGEKFLVYRLGTSGELSNRNAGNAQAVARYIMGTEDPMGPVSSRAAKVQVYEVTLDEGTAFGKYEGLTGGRAGKEGAVGRVVRDSEVAYSFPEKGYKSKLVGERSLDHLRQKLMNAGYQSFDDAGSNIGARAIREAFSESEAPPAIRGSEPPPPRGSRGEAGGAEGTTERDPVREAAKQFVDSNPERLVRVGSDADGAPIMRTVKEYLKEARDAVKQAKTDTKLFEAAAMCLLGRA